MNSKDYKQNRDKEKKNKYREIMNKYKNGEII
jgi:hypothetical protein